MKDIKELAAMLKRLYKGYLQGNDSALEQMQTLAWVTDLPVELIQELLSDERSDISEEEYKKAIESYTSALLQIEELKKENKTLSEQLSHKQEQTQLVKKHESDAQDFRQMAEAYESEVKALKEQREADAQKIKALEGNLKRKDVGNTVLLYYGEEKNKYPCEQRDIVLEILCDELERTPKGTRRHDVLESIVSVNQYMGIPAMNAYTVKKMFRSGRDFDDRFIEDLKKLGIETKKCTKHYLLSLGGDGRYTVTVPSTKSDVRSNANVAAEIVKNMF